MKQKTGSEGAAAAVLEPAVFLSPTLLGPLPQVPQAREAAALTELAIHRLQQVGIRPTASRQAVWTALWHADMPLTQHDVQRALCADQPKGNLSAVYTALRLMEQKKLVRKVKLPSQGCAQYALAEKPFTQLLVCRRCGAYQWFSDSQLHEAIEQFGRRIGRTTSDYQVTVQLDSCWHCDPQSFTENL